MASVTIEPWTHLRAAGVAPEQLLRALGER
jgi:hypothetical protein